MNRWEHWFCRILKMGICANLALTIPILIAPAWMLSRFSMPLPEPLVYARLAAFLVILLSISYLPAALDPERYRIVAWFTLLSRMAAALFFVTAAIALDEVVLCLPAVLDFSFFLSQGILLVLGVREGNRSQSAALGIRARSSS